MNGIRLWELDKSLLLFSFQFLFLVRLREGTGGMGRSALEKREVGVRRDF